MNISDLHPYRYISSFVYNMDDKIDSLHFSYYRYVPQTLADDRRLFEVNAKDFLNEALMTQVLNTCPPGMELAFHSTVRLKSGQLVHIPMVDMFTNSPALLEKLKPFWGEELYPHVKWYKSGRSFHGYVGKLIGSNDWVSLMGRLLLVNQPHLPPMVDPRWVGHRLTAGYAALRWTCNTSHYIMLPRAISGNERETST